MLRTRSLLALVAVSWLAVAGATAAEPAPPPIVVDPLAVRALLAARDFDALEARFAAARASRDSHETTALLWTIESLTSREHVGLEEWVRERPESIPARLALAERELDRAWKARGSGFGHTVGQAAHAEMRTRLERCLTLAAEVAERDPSWLDARRLQIQAAQLLGDRVLAERAFEAALATDPSHYGVWWSYANLFQRRWGGSYERQQEIAGAAQTHALANPRLRRLLGVADRDRAADLRLAGRHAEALAAYDRALAYGDDGHLRASRSEVLARIGDPAGARAEIDAGLAIDPHVTKLHDARARQCMAERDFPCMLAAASRALALEPDSESAQTLHTWAAWAVEHPTLATRNLERNPLQRWLYANGYWIYHHAFDAAALAALAGVGWYAARALRRRRSERDAAAAPIVRVPAEAPVGRRLPMVERLPRSGVLMLRAYVCFLIVHEALVYSEAFRPGIGRAPLVTDLVITVVALGGALAFAHGIRLGRPVIWKVWALLFPLWNQFVAIGIQGFTWQQWSLWGFLHLTLLPAYTALFLYGYSCGRLWQGGLPGPGWASGGRSTGRPRRARPARG